MKTLEELEKQIASNWSIEYRDWTMLIIEGRNRKTYRYYHQCKGDIGQFVVPVIRVCETCLVSMPEKVWQHFLKTQIFIKPPLSEIEKFLQDFAVAVRLRK